MRVAAVALLVPLFAGCAGSAPEVQDPIEVGAPSASTPSRPRRPRSAEHPDGVVGVSRTFPKGLDWVTQVPPERAPKAQMHATPSIGLEGEQLAVKLAEEVLESRTELVADGPTIVMNVRAPDEILVTMPMQPGGCYGLYAKASDGVELDATLLIDTAGALPLPGPLAGVPLATDTDQGPTARIGVGSGACFKAALPMAIPALAKVVAREGAGLVAVQLLASAPN